MVKGLSCRKIAAVNIYSGKLYQGDLQLHVKLFSRNYFPGKHLKDFQSEWDFRFQKLLIRRIKNITQMVQAEFLKFQNQLMQVSESKFEFALQKKKKKKRKDKGLLKLSGM